MANTVFGWPIYSDHGKLHKPSLSSGSWVSSLPSSAVQDRRLSRVARSSSAAATSTRLQVDLKAQRLIGVVALILPNLTGSGTVRVRASNTAGSFGSPLYDSGTVTVVPLGETAETLGDIKPTFIKAFTPLEARYWYVEIFDTTNPDGYVDVARLAIAGAWQPSINMRMGARLGLETETSRVFTRRGSALYDRAPTRRSQDMDIEMLRDTEAMRAFDMQRIAGIDEQMVYVFDPDDPPELMIRRSYLATLRSLNALEAMFYDANRVPLQVLEEL